ncbi:MAG: hypothetical protein GEU93_01100 [Propionibacteriales bacterium]|nr:hypothetical protein [Propionibacteriales bacterium]
MRRARTRTSSGPGSLRLLGVTVATFGLLAGCTGGDQSDQNLGEIVPPMSIVYYAPDAGPTYEQSARVLAEDFGEIGLQVDLQPMQQTKMVDEVHVGGNLEDLALGSWGGDPDRLDPSFWVFDLSACDSDRNAVKWCDQGYTQLAQQQATTLDENERKDLVWQAQEEFQSKLPWWPISHEVQGIVYNSERWENITAPEPIPPHETVIDPWLQMQPLSDDRVIDWAYYEDVSTYNPLAETTSKGWIRFVYDTFLRFDGEELIPWAAESWDAVDDTTIELQLRDGMTFHDGRPVTAEDAVFSINLVVDQQPPSVADALHGVEGAEQVDDRTLRINLSEPNAGIFRQTLTQLWILPKHIWEGVSDPLNWDPIRENAVIGSGPFAFESWEPNQQHVLTTHTDHWEAPDYDGIRRLSLGQADAVRTAMLDGTADIASDVLPAASMQDLAEEEDHLEFMEYPSFNTITVWMNHEKPPFDDYEFRRALRLATDKERVALEGWLGFAETAGEGNVPTALGEWHNPELEEIQFDLEQARQALEDAGYGWDDDGRLHFPAGGGQ